MMRINLNVVIFVLIIAGVALYKSRFDSEELSLKSKASSKPVTKEVPNTIVTKNPGSSSPEVKREIASIHAGKPSSAKLKAATLPYSKELAVYSVIRRKVFLSPTDQNERDKLLKNSAMLKSMGQRLLLSASDDAAATEQNVAVDFLLDAMRSGDYKVASEVLKNVISDGQVEDATLDLPSRENLAGIKAEVLYQWSALNPVKSDEMATWLPGPVSKRIWKNVVNAQASNMAESADAD